MQGLRASVAFSFTNGATSAPRLADVVGAAPLDADALAARLLILPPTERSETPYLGVTCSLNEPRLPSASPTTTMPARAPRVSRADAPAALRRALEAALERTLGDARVVGVMAGGGLDSSALLALTVRWAHPRGAEVFAVALDYGARGDDRPYLRLLEERIGCPVMRVRPEEGAQHVPPNATVDAAPFVWPGGPMEAELMRRARLSGADCVLMGVGGDELFDGEPHALARVLRRGAAAAAVRSARALRGFERPRSRTFSWLVRPLLAEVTPVALRMRLARRQPAWAPPWAGPRLTQYVRRIRRRDLGVLETNLRRGVVVDPEASERHRLNMAWLRHQEEIVAGIERRDPYLDRGLAEVVASFEPEWLLQGDVRRGLFREALRDLLPEQLIEREDKAFFEPAFLRLVGGVQGLEAMRDLATGEALAALGLVEPVSFGAAFDDFVKAPEACEPWMTVWPALCLERFLRARQRG